MNSEGSKISHPESGRAMAKLKKSWMSWKHDAQYRHKTIKSLCLCLMYYCLGLVRMQQGPTILDLQLITKTNVQQASAFLTAGGVGYMAGSLALGLLYDHVKKDRVKIVCLVLVAVTTTVKPYCSPYWLMIVASFMVNCFCACCAGALNADMVRVWNGKTAAGIQALLFSYSLGAVVAPLITEPFVAPADWLRKTEQNTNGFFNLSTTDPGSTTEDYVYKNLQSLSNEKNMNFNRTFQIAPWVSITHAQTAGNETNMTIGLNDEHTNRSLNPLSEERIPETKVHFAYFIAAAMTLFSMLPYFLEQTVMRKRAQSRRKERCVPGDGDMTEQTTEEEIETIQTQFRKQQGIRLDLPLKLRLVMLLWMCVLYVVYFGVDFTLSTYLTTFSVLHLQWSIQQGTILTSVYFIFATSFRFINIFLIKVFTPTHLLLLSLSVFLVSQFILMLSSVWYWDIGVWFSTAVCGTASSAVIPVTLAWVGQELFPLNGRVFAAALLSSSLGATIDPMIVGYLINDFGAIWLIYFTLGNAVLCVLIFLLMLFVTRFYIHRKYAAHDVRASSEGERPPTLSS